MEEVPCRALKCEAEVPMQRTNTGQHAERCAWREVGKELVLEGIAKEMKQQAVAADAATQLYHHGHLNRQQGIPARKQDEQACQVTQCQCVSNANSDNEKENTTG